MSRSVSKQMQKATDRIQVVLERYALNEVQSQMGSVAGYELVSHKSGSEVLVTVIPLQPSKPSALARLNRLRGLPLTAIRSNK